MSDIPIAVSTYSGYRAGERPLAFSLHGDNIHVMEILDMWIEEGVETRLRKRFFVLRGSDNRTHTIYAEEKTGNWFYVR